MTEKEVKPFVESWQINDKDPHLFQENREPQFPAKCEYYEPPKKASFRERRLKETKTISVEEAKTKCAPHPPGPMRKFCIDDIINTGIIETAEDSFYG